MLLRDLEFRIRSDDVFVYLDLREDNDFDFYRFYSNGDSDTIGQYIGLKDKNGKKIYEGDILRDIDHVGKVHIVKVEYDDNFASFYCETNNGACWSFEDAKGDDLEIIGNIYDNPELLGKE